MGKKLSKETIAKMIASRKANREARLAKKAEKARALEMKKDVARARELPLRILKVEGDAEEFARFLVTAWNIYRER